ncbi:unnamed protein product [Prorocentrum cordatum]|uniref:Uncharacterized protein n=1 Tax=Prorocentrum cordatum TaxID=2364126 RepID=A0ABN9V545_9DINO|nr:unnamed protein product [Polarella glacialis]
MFAKRHREIQIRGRRQGVHLPAETISADHSGIRWPGGGRLGCTQDAERAVRNGLQERLEALEPLQRLAVLQRCPNTALDPSTESGKPADAAKRQASKAEPSDPLEAEVARLVCLVIKIGHGGRQSGTPRGSSTATRKRGGAPTSFEPDRHELKCLKGFLDHIGEMVQAPALSSSTFSSC